MPEAERRLQTRGRRKPGAPGQRQRLQHSHSISGQKGAAVSPKSRHAPGQRLTLPML